MPYIACIIIKLVSTHFNVWLLKNNDINLNKRHLNFFKRCNNMFLHTYKYQTTIKSFLNLSLWSWKFNFNSLCPLLTMKSYNLEKEEYGLKLLIMKNSCTTYCVLSCCKVTHQMFLCLFMKRVRNKICVWWGH
jgi:hypothetical protein